MAIAAGMLVGVVAFYLLVWCGAASREGPPYSGRAVWWIRYKRAVRNQTGALIGFLWGTVDLVAVGAAYLAVGVGIPACLGFLTWFALS